MAIAFDAASNSGYLSSTGTYTGSHTCTGSNRYLVLSLAVFIPEVITEGDSHDPRYNGVTMTLLRSKTTADGFIRSELWGLVAPASGSNTVSVQLLEANADFVACLSSFTGVDQSTPTEGVADATGLAGSSTVDVTVSTDQSWVIDVIASDDTSITAGDGQTARGQQTGARGTGAQSTEGPVSPSTVTMNWTDSSDRWAMCAIALRPPASTQTATPATATVTITGIAPVVSATGPVTVTPDSEPRNHVVITAIQPTAAFGTATRTPGSTELEILARKPDPYATGTVTVTPSIEPRLTVTVSAIAPARSATGSAPATPAAASVTVSGIAPTATAFGTVTVTPESEPHTLVTISAVSPTTIGTGTVSRTPATASVIVSAISPTASPASTVSRSSTAASVTVSAIAPTATGQGTITLTPAVASVTVSAFAPTITVPGTASRTSTAASAIISGIQPAASGTATATATPAVATVTITGIDGNLYATGTQVGYPDIATVTVSAIAASFIPTTVTKSPIVAFVIVSTTSPVPGGWILLDCPCCEEPESGGSGSGPDGDPITVDCCPSPIPRTLYMTFGTGCTTTLTRPIGPCTIRFFYNPSTLVWEPGYSNGIGPIDYDASGCPVSGSLQCDTGSWIFTVNTGYYVGGGECSYQPFGTTDECAGGICAFTTESCDPLFLESVINVSCTVTVTE